MENYIIFSLPGNDHLTKEIQQKLNIELGESEIRQFPDGESYVRIKSHVQDKLAFVLCSLNSPNDKIIPLYFLCKTLKDLNAKKVILISPYLSYMRQDIRFKEGEALASSLFANLLSSFIDQLITVDAHLHRLTALKEIFKIPAINLHSASVVSNWIKKNVQNPIIIGPDIESNQWAADVAKQIQSEYFILEKIRKGDKNVEIITPKIPSGQGRTIILVDDIISTGETMIQSVLELHKTGFPKPICLAIHAVFAEKAFNNLIDSGAMDIVTTNTIIHKTNKINISQIIIEYIQKAFTTSK